MRKSRWIALGLLITCCFRLSAQVDTVYFTVAMQQREQHKFDVSMQFMPPPGDYVDIRMPVWSPGYYQILNYAEHVDNFSARLDDGQVLQWERHGHDGWRVFGAASDSSAPDVVHLQYTIIAERPFVATSYIDTSRAFIKPASVFMYIDGQLRRPARVAIKAPQRWPNVATGLDAVRGQQYVFEAADFDILYDSPLLVGQLRSLPSFEVDGKKHRFIGYGMSSDFNADALMDDIHKIVVAAKAVVTDQLPYDHYTFIGIGPGQGGIEQLNSTAISFTGEELEGQGRLQTLSFIAHEYFLHFNVKRIRPVELGPFDYSQPNRTDLLWVGEGLTVYYENILLHRTGLINGQQMLDDWASTITNLENNPGRFKQTLAESSWKTWEDGPFGNPGETISYYVKGPIIAMLLDIEIRHATGNQRSLDDVMRRLYSDYYMAAGRGFTSAEVRQVCESVAGAPLNELFDYIYTTKAIDYRSYFTKAGLDITFDKVQQPDGSERVKARITTAPHADTLTSAVRKGLIGDPY